MQLHRLKAGPAKPHAMIEVSILLSVINQTGRNVASIFCLEIIKKFPAEPLAATRGAPVEKHCPTDSASLLVYIFFKLFDLVLGFSVGDVTMRVCFCIFEQLYLALGANPMSHFWLKIILFEN